MSAEQCMKAILERGEVKEKREKLDKMKETLRNGHKYLINMSTEVLKLEGELNAISLVDNKLLEQLTGDLNSIKSVPIVEDAFFENERIVFITKPLVAHCQDGTEVPIPAMKTSLNLVTSEVNGFCEKPDDDGVYGYWSERDPHPHFDGRNGHPCLGNAACSITEYITNQQYFLAVLQVLEFIQAVNEEDSAGSRYKRWIEKFN